MSLGLHSGIQPISTSRRTIQTFKDFYTYKTNNTDIYEMFAIWNKYSNIPRLNS